MDDEKAMKLLSPEDVEENLSKARVKDEVKISNVRFWNSFYIKKKQCNFRSIILINIFKFLLNGLINVKP